MIVVAVRPPLDADEQARSDCFSSQVMSLITSPTALILPVEEVCRRAREAGVLTVIDGARTPGQIPVGLDTMGADFCTGNCHKWMCVPKGTGVFVCAPVTVGPASPDCRG